MSLKEFKKENCSKCGNNDIALQYCEWEEPGKICWCIVGENEHMHHYCRTCAFEWLTKVKK